MWKSGTTDPMGFVEPEPDFFSRMANLAQAISPVLEKEGAFEPDYIGVAESILLFHKKYAALKNVDAFLEIFHDLPTSGQADLLTAYVLLGCAPSEADYNSDKAYRDNVAWMKSAADDILAGRIDQESVAIRLAEQQGNLAELWKQLEWLSMALDSIAQKQLRGVALSPIDESCIREYGKSLADLCFYEGNSYSNPRDDAPKLIDVYSNLNTEKHLHVGIARPRKMYVLYPWEGREVLCEGAVMPYYEFAHPTRLNDAEWKSMLDSDARPPILDWLAPIVHGGALNPPTLKD